jgi:WD40 repeat protein
MNVLIRATLLLIITVFSLSSYAQAISAQDDNLVYVTAVAWSNDGSKIAAVGIKPPGTQGYIRVLDIQTGNTLYELNPSPGGFSSVVWSPDDRFIAMGGYDQVIQIIDVQSLTLVASLQGHQSTVTAVDWNRDGTQLVSSGNWDGLTLLWDVTTYKQSHIVESGNLFPTHVSFSPDGQRIAVGGEGGIRIYASNGSTDENPSWYFKDLNIGALAWNSDGSRIAFGTQTFPSVTNPNVKPAAQLYIFDSINGTQLSNWLTEDETVTGIAWSPDQNLIATDSLDSVIKIWDATSGERLESFIGNRLNTTRYPRHISFSPYGGRLAYGSAIPSEAIVSSEPQTDDAGAVSLAGGAIQIVVPAPSRERLQAIAVACNAPAPVQEALAAQTESINDLAAQVEALPEGTIPPACAADLIAVANALQSG